VILLSREVLRILPLEHPTSRWIWSMNLNFWVRSLSSFAFMSVMLTCLLALRPQNLPFASSFPQIDILFASFLLCTTRYQRDKLSAFFQLCLCPTLCFMIILFFVHGIYSFPSSFNEQPTISSPSHNYSHIYRRILCHLSLLCHICFRGFLSLFVFFFVLSFCFFLVFLSFMPHSVIT